MLVLRRQRVAGREGLFQDMIHCRFFATLFARSEANVIPKGAVEGIADTRERHPVLRAARSGHARYDRRQVDLDQLVI